jgi:hypothetical protein
MLMKTLTNPIISPTTSTPPVSTPATTAPPPASTGSSAPDNAASGTQSWAAVGKVGSTTGNVDIASKNRTKKQYIYYNKDGYRLDDPLPPKEKAAFEAIDARMRKVQ